MSILLMVLFMLLPVCPPLIGEVVGRISDRLKPVLDRRSTPSPDNHKTTFDPRATRKTS